MKNNASVDLLDKYSNSALKKAVTKGHKEVVALLLENNASVDFIYGYDKETALMLAAKNGHAEIVVATMEPKFMFKINLDTQH